MFNVEKNHAPQTSEEVFYQAGTHSSCFQNTPQEPVNLTQFCPPGSGTPEEDKPQLFGPIKIYKQYIYSVLCTTYYIQFIFL